MCSEGISTTAYSGCLVKRWFMSKWSECGCVMRQYCTSHSDTVWHKASVNTSGPKSTSRSRFINTEERLLRLGPPRSHACLQLEQWQKGRGYDVAAPVPRNVICIMTLPLSQRPPSPFGH